MLLVAFQAKAANFFVKLAEFFGVLNSFGNAFGQGRTLASVDAGAMKFGDGIPPDVTLRVE